MDFYGKTDDRIIYVSTYGAVMDILTEIQNSKHKVQVNWKFSFNFLESAIETISQTMITQFWISIWWFLFFLIVSNNISYQILFSLDTNNLAN
jgi:hypothetical protein